MLFKKRGIFPFKLRKNTISITARHRIFTRGINPAAVLPLKMVY
jgi:hypothetical protein